MKNIVSKLILVLFDCLAVLYSISLAYFFRTYIDDWVGNSLSNSIMFYVGNPLLYIVVLLVFLNEKLYTYRYDFWEETRIVLRSLLISFILVLSILALMKNIEVYSRLVIIFSFIFMALLIPFTKNFLKKKLYKTGLWKKKAEVYGDEKCIEKEIFGNSYLGYVHSKIGDAETVFIDTENITVDDLQEQLDMSLKERKEVLFIPFLQSYNLANARIIELSNTRKNLIVLENALLKKRNKWTKKISDLLFGIFLFPFLGLFFLVIVSLMKREEPSGKIFFKQKRMGKNGKEFICYKFRSMYEDGAEVLEAYLKDNPDEIIHYDKYHKYKNDPRITRVGKVLRKTSLDEVPQIINVLKGEMSIIGPRPYMPSEREKIGTKFDMILAVKPGITGLWQVSGRNEVDFYSRVDMDVWYTRNWNLWLDFVILVKTTKVVLFRNGAH